MSTEDSVARYYDRNTRRFLRFGGGAGALAIHRELWPPGVSTAEEAKRTVNRLLGQAIADRDVDAPVILDLGCGVGGTLFELAGRFPAARLHGVTVSPRQVEMGRALARERHLEARCRFHRGDFHRLELHAEDADLRADAVVAVESFAHASEPRAFFSTVAERLRPGGVLVVVDDFLTREPENLDPAGARLARDFASGWRLGSLMTSMRAVELAHAAGLSLGDERDLTPLIRLGRPRDRVIRLLAPIFSSAGLVDVPFFGNMIGGNALQEGIRSGVIGYRMLELEKRSVAEP